MTIYLHLVMVEALSTLDSYGWLVLSSESPALTLLAVSQVGHKTSSCSPDMNTCGLAHIPHLGIVILV